MRIFLAQQKKHHQIFKVTEFKGKKKEQFLNIPCISVVFHPFLMRYYNCVMVSKQKMLSTRKRSSDLSCLCQSSLIHSEERVFNLQMGKVGLLLPLAQLSIKKEKKKKKRQKISAIIHHYQTFSFLSQPDML